MIREYLAHFEYVKVAVAGQLLFLAAFLMILYRTFRKGSEHIEASRIPLEEGEPQ